MMRRHDLKRTPLLDRRRFVAAAALAPALIGRALAQSWPNRYVRLIVPFPPGGGTDAIARIVAGKLSEIWGQQMVVENRGGAATNIGTEAVARAEPDGYTMLLCSLNMAVNRYLFPSLNYDPVADFAPVSLICDYPNVMAVPISSPAHSVTEFIAYAKANKVNADIVTALADPTTKERLEQLGVVVAGSTPAELAAHLKTEMDKWGPVIKEAGITMNE